MGTLHNITGDPVAVASLPPISRKRQVRIKQVQELFDTGWKVNEIALFLDLSTRTIYLDLKDGKKLDHLFLNTLDQEEVIGREIRLLETARRTEWGAYQLENNHFVKVAIMRNILTIHEKLIKLLQGVGLVTKVPETIEMGLPFQDPEDVKEYMTLKAKVIAKAREK
jgi:hypothetical protein